MKVLRLERGAGAIVVRSAYICEEKQPMAGKSGAGKGGGGPSRIRFILLDAELPDGDIGQITQALQNALRPPEASPGPKRMIGMAPPKGSQGASANPPDASEELQADEENVELEEENTATSTPRSGPRKYRTPKVLELDLDSGVSFVSFAEPKKPTSDAKRFLVIAAWFKLHRDTPAITVDHIYTCYRKIKWPSAIDDFSKPFRKLKFVQHVEQKGKGLYAINHLGLQEVDDLPGG